FPRPDGAAPDYVRLKPSLPRTGRDGRLVKYEAPKGLPLEPYFPPHVLPLLADASVPLLLTEGEKKALRACQDGFPCLGFCGVWAWQQRRPRSKGGSAKGERKLLPLLEAVAWEGRRVTIIFDADAATNDHVAWAEWYLAEALGARQARVRVVRLPGGPT